MEGNNYFAAVESILLILDKTDVFLFTKGVCHVVGKILNFYPGLELVILL